MPAHIRGGGGLPQSIGSIGNVSAPSPQPGHGLFYNGALSKYQDQPITIGSVEKTTPFSTNQTTYQDITGLSLTLTLPDGPVWLEMYAPLIDVPGSASAAARIDTVIYDVTAGAIVQTGYSLAYLVAGGTLCIRRRVSPGAGTRAYKVQGQVETGTITGRWYASATDVMYLAVLRG